MPFGVSWDLPRSSWGPSGGCPGISFALHAAPVAEIKDAACRFVSVRAGCVFEVLRFVPVRVKIRLRVTRFVSRVSEICLRVMRVGIRAPHCVFV